MDVFFFDFVFAGFVYVCVMVYLCVYCVTDYVSFVFCLLSVGFVCACFGCCAF